MLQLTSLRQQHTIQYLGGNVFMRGCSWAKDSNIEPNISAPLGKGGSSGI